MATKFFNLDTDPTLSSNSDHLIASQKAIKTALGTKVDKTTTINGKSLSDNIELSAFYVNVQPLAVATAICSSVNLSKLVCPNFNVLPVIPFAVKSYR